MTPVNEITSGFDFNFFLSPLFIYLFIYLFSF